MSLIYELRPGNNVMVDGKMAYVSTVYPQLIEINDKTIAKYDKRQVEAVEINEALLLEHGFTKEGIEYHHPLGALKMIFRFATVSEKKVAYCEIGGIYMGDQIQTFHRLQNLYQSLTGKELRKTAANGT